jgi:hypothetical protein
LVVLCAYGVDALHLSIVNHEQEIVEVYGYPLSPVEYGDDEESQARWGAGAFQNGLGFTGVSPIYFDMGDIFEIERLRYFISDLNHGTLLPELNVALNLNDTDSTGWFALPFGYQTTRDPRQETPLPYIAGDFEEEMEIAAENPSTEKPYELSEALTGEPVPIVNQGNTYVPNALSGVAFDVAGTSHTFHVMGLGTAPDPPGDQLPSFQYSTINTRLFRWITLAHVDTVPEPSTLVLLGLGMLFLTVVTERIRKRQTQANP